MCGPYLNSAKFIKYFLFMQKLLIKFENNDNSLEYQIKLRTDHASPSLNSVQTLESPYGTLVRSTDSLFCVPLRWDAKYRQKFLRRLKPNKWPMSAVRNLEHLLKERVYAVPKPNPNSENGDFQWRLSFSVIELELARSLTDIQRRCYRVLKAMVKYDVNADLSEKEKFPSYYLKTIMFIFCEKVSENTWQIQHLGMLWLKIIDSIIDCLEKRKLPMYFVPTYNLLEDKDTSSINVWKKRLKEIRKNPLKSITNFFTNYVVTDSFENWGQVYCLLEVLNMLYADIAQLKHCKDGIMKLQNQQHAASFMAAMLTQYVAEYMLAIYTLSDFLVFEKFYQYLNSPVCFTVIPHGYVHSKEFLIWMYYNKAFNIDGIFFSLHCGKYADLWAHLGEVTHHICLKYQEGGPDKNVFSTLTTEQFYLISCSIEHRESNINIAKYIKYANYLRLNKRFEESVQILMNLCRREPKWNCCRFSKLTSEVLDACLKLPLTFQNEIYFGNVLFEYHLLTCCYIEAGVLAEVCFPYVLDYLSLEGHVRFSAGKVLLGFQYITSGHLHKALQVFASVEDTDLLEYKILSYTIKYEAMFFIFARLFSVRHA